METLHNLYTAFFGADVLIAPEYLLLSLGLAFVLYRSRSVEGGFWAWALPKRIWRHPSHRVDMQLFIIGRLLVFVGLFNKISVTTLTAIWVAGIVGGAGLSGGTISPWALALLLFLAEDGTLYWLHRLYHRHKLIWPIHAVHHQAEVMTPITAYRQHPLSLVLVTVVVSGCVGIAQGLVIGLVDPSTTIATVAGINAILFTLSLIFANFRHSHIWISFGPVLERVLISPAQHQIHHSVDPAHHNRNFGETLALWDWMFGTLALAPRADAGLQFGLTDEHGRPAPGAGHLGHTMWKPFRDIAAAVRRQN
ncbi:MAG: sterol desaturase family protein [Pseudomonadota bacterium]